MKKFSYVALTGLVLAALGMQFVPVDRSNPPTTREVRWDAPETRALAVRACFDCHSNETRWPWYARVAPASWRVADHVAEGREHLNFSEWDRPNEDLDEVVEVMDHEEMPLWDYLLLHPEARLTEAETAALVEGLKRTMTDDPPIERRRRVRSEDADS